MSTVEKRNDGHAELRRSLMHILRGPTAVLAGMAMPGLALAGPDGGQVIEGQAEITAPDSQTTQVDQSTDRAVIEWQSFDVAGDEYVIFNQPTSSSVVLNRVIGGSPSAIFGTIQANGHVFLVNPQGIYFGGGAVIDVQGILASTLDIDDGDFMDGNYDFVRSPDSPETASVVNEGLIRAGDGGFVVLAGDYVNNSGVITARAGVVALGAGAGITLDLEGDGLVSYTVNEATLASLAGVDNIGSILADGSVVMMTAEVANSLRTTAVNQSGLIEAYTVGEQDGVVVLNAEGGDISQTGAILADGGDVILRASGRTTHEGVIEADGGFVEVSGDDGIRVRGVIEADGGRILIDPATITIGSATGDILTGSIETMLDGGADVDVVATSSITANTSAQAAGITATGTGDLFIGIGAFGTLPSSSMSFFAASGGSIDLGSMDIDVAGAFQASASDGQVSLADVSASAIDIDGQNITAGALTATAGSVDIDARLNSGSGSATVTAGDVSAAGGGIFVDASTGYGAASISLGNLNASSGSIYLNADGSGGSSGGAFITVGNMTAGGYVSASASHAGFIADASVTAGDVFTNSYAYFTANAGWDGDATISVGNVTATGGTGSNNYLGAFAYAGTGSGDVASITLGDVNADNYASGSAGASGNSGIATISVGNVSAGSYVDISAGGHGVGSLTAGNIVAGSYVELDAHASSSGTGVISAGNITGAGVVDLEVGAWSGTGTITAGNITVTGTSPAHLLIATDTGSSGTGSITVGDISVTGTGASTGGYGGGSIAYIAEGLGFAGYGFGGSSGGSFLSGYDGYGNASALVEIDAGQNGSVHVTGGITVVGNAGSFSVSNSSSEGFLLASNGYGSRGHAAARVAGEDVTIDGDVDVTGVGVAVFVAEGMGEGDVTLNGDLSVTAAASSVKGVLTSSGMPCCSSDFVNNSVNFGSGGGFGSAATPGAGSGFATTGFAIARVTNDSGDVALGDVSVSGPNAGFIAEGLGSSNAGDFTIGNLSVTASGGSLGVTYDGAGNGSGTGSGSGGSSYSSMTRFATDRGIAVVDIDQGGWSNGGVSVGAVTVSGTGLAEVDIEGANVTIASLDVAVADATFVFSASHNGSVSNTFSYGSFSTGGFEQSVSSFMSGSIVGGQAYVDLEGSAWSGSGSASNSFGNLTVGSITVSAGSATVYVEADTQLTVSGTIEVTAAGNAWNVHETTFFAEGNFSTASSSGSYFDYSRSSYASSGSFTGSGQGTVDVGEGYGGYGGGYGGPDIGSLIGFEGEGAWVNVDGYGGFDIGDVNVTGPDAYLRIETYGDGTLGSATVVATGNDGSFSSLEVDAWANRSSSNTSSGSSFNSSSGGSFSQETTMATFTDVGDASISLRAWGGARASSSGTPFDGIVNATALSVTGQDAEVDLNLGGGSIGSITVTATTGTISVSGTDTDGDVSGSLLGSSEAGPPSIGTATFTTTDAETFSSVATGGRAAFEASIESGSDGYGAYGGGTLNIATLAIDGAGAAEGMVNAAEGSVVITDLSFNVGRGSASGSYTRSYSYGGGSSGSSSNHAGSSTSSYTVDGAFAEGLAGYGGGYGAAPTVGIGGYGGYGAGSLSFEGYGDGRVQVDTLVATGPTLSLYGSINDLDLGAVSLTASGSDVSMTRSGTSNGYSSGTSSSYSGGFSETLSETGGFVDVYLEDYESGAGHTIAIDSLTVSGGEVVVRIDTNDIQLGSVALDASGIVFSETRTSNNFHIFGGTNNSFSSASGDFGAASLSLFGGSASDGSSAWVGGNVSVTGGISLTGMGAASLYIGVSHGSSGQPGAIDVQGGIDATVDRASSHYTGYGSFNGPSGSGAGDFSRDVEGGVFFGTIRGSGGWSGSASNTIAVDQITVAAGSASLNIEGDSVAVGDIDLTASGQVWSLAASSMQAGGFSGSGQSSSQGSGTGTYGIGLDAGGPPIFDGGYGGYGAVGPSYGGVAEGAVVSIQAYLGASGSGAGQVDLGTVNVSGPDATLYVKGSNVSIDDASVTATGNDATISGMASFAGGPPAGPSSGSVSSFSVTATNLGYADASIEGISYGGSSGSAGGNVDIGSLTVTGHVASADVDGQSVTIDDVNVTATRGSYSANFAEGFLFSGSGGSLALPSFGSSPFFGFQQSSTGSGGAAYLDVGAGTVDLGTVNVNGEGHASVQIGGSDVTVGSLTVDAGTGNFTRNAVISIPGSGPPGVGIAEGVIASLDVEGAFSEMSFGDAGIGEGVILPPLAAASPGIGPGPGIGEGLVSFVNVGGNNVDLGDVNVTAPAVYVDIQASDSLVAGDIAVSATGVTVDGSSTQIIADIVAASSGASITDGLFAEGATFSGQQGMADLSLRSWGSSGSVGDITVSGPMAEVNVDNSGAFAAGDVTVTATGAQRTEGFETVYYFEGSGGPGSFGFAEAFVSSGDQTAAEFDADGGSSMSFGDIVVTGPSVSVNLTAAAVTAGAIDLDASGGTATGTSSFASSGGTIVAAPTPVPVGSATEDLGLAELYGSNVTATSVDVQGAGIATVYVDGGDLGVLTVDAGSGSFTRSSSEGGSSGDLSDALVGGDFDASTVTITAGGDVVLGMGGSVDTLTVTAGGDITNSAPSYIGSVTAAPAIGPGGGDLLLGGTGSFHLYVGGSFGSVGLAASAASLDAGGSIGLYGSLTIGGGSLAGAQGDAFVDRLLGDSVTPNGVISAGDGLDLSALSLTFDGDYLRINTDDISFGGSSPAIVSSGGVSVGSGAVVQIVPQGAGAASYDQAYFDQVLSGFAGGGTVMLGGEAFTGDLTLSSISAGSVNVAYATQGDVATAGTYSGAAVTFVGGSGSLDATLNVPDVTVLGFGTVDLDLTANAGSGSVDFGGDSRSAVDVAMTGETTFTDFGKVTNLGLTAAGDLALEGLNATNLDVTAGGELSLLSGNFNNVTADATGLTIGAVGTATVDMSSITDPLVATFSDTFGTVALTVGGDLDVDGPVDGGSLAVVANGSGTIDISGETFTMDGDVSLTAGGDILLSDVDITGVNGTFIAGGDVLNGGAVGSINLDAIAVLAGGDVILDDTTLIIGNGQIIGASGDQVVIQVLDAFNVGPQSGAPNATFLAGGVLVLGDLTMAGDHLFAQADDIDFNGTVSVPSGGFVQLAPFTSGNVIGFDLNQDESVGGTNFSFADHFANFDAITIGIGSSAHTGDILVGQSLAAGNDQDIDIGDSNFIAITLGTVTGLENIQTTGLVGTLEGLAELDFFIPTTEEVDPFSGDGASGALGETDLDPTSDGDDEDDEDDEGGDGEDGDGGDGDGDGDGLVSQKSGASGDGDTAGVCGG